MTAAPSLLAGAAQVDITPAGRVFLFGYPHVPRVSTGVHDPLRCAALYVRSADQAVLFLAHDLIFLSREFVADMRQRIHAACGVPEHAILLSATHTHSGPVTVEQLSNGADPVVPPVDRGYLAWLAERMVEAALLAVHSAVPAEIAVTSARANGVGTNRHDPAGPADPEVQVLLARPIHVRQPLACMFVYAMHPTVLHEDSTLISADFVHYAREWLQVHAVPRSCVLLHHQGASGNQSPRHTARANTFAEARRLGELLARAIAEAIPRAAYEAQAALRVTPRRLELEPREFPSVEAAVAALEEAKARYLGARNSGAARQDVRTAECDVFGAEETLQLARAAVDGQLAAAVAACSPAEIQLIQIGGWNIVAWPGEFFVEHALELKRRAPGTVLITLANGELQGYIATEEAEQRGYYEARNALFAASNGRRFIDATLELLRTEGGSAA